MSCYYFSMGAAILKMWPINYTDTYTAWKVQFPRYFRFFLVGWGVILNDQRLNWVTVVFRWASLIRRLGTGTSFYNPGEGYVMITFSRFVCRLSVCWFVFKITQKVFDDWMESRPNHSIIQKGRYEISIKFITDQLVSQALYARLWRN